MTRDNACTLICVGYLLIAFVTAAPFEFFGLGQPTSECREASFPDWARGLGYPPREPRYGIGKFGFGGDKARPKHVYLMIGQEMWKCTKGQKPIRDIFDDYHEYTMNGNFYDVGDRIMRDPQFALNIETERALRLPELEGEAGFVREYRERRGPRRSETWHFYNFENSGNDHFNLIELQSITPPSGARPVFHEVEKAVTPTVPWLRMGITPPGKDFSEKTLPPSSVWRVATHGNPPTGICKQDFKKPFDISGLYWFYGDIPVDGVSNDPICRKRKEN